MNDASAHKGPFGGYGGEDRPLFYLQTLAPTVLYYDPIEFPDSVVLQI